MWFAARLGVVSIAGLSLLGCPSISTQTKAMSPVAGRALYQLTCDNGYDCVLTAGNICRAGVYRHYSCHRWGPVVELVVCANPGDTWKDGEGYLEQISTCDSASVERSIATEGTRVQDRAASLAAEELRSLEEGERARRSADAGATD